MAHVVVAIDPGASETGVICRRWWHNGDELLRAVIVDRSTLLTSGGPDLQDYISAVLHEVAAAHRTHEHAAEWMVAVEDLNPPTPHMGVTSVGGLIGTAQIIGAVLACYPRAVLVPPAGHGSGPLAAYPPELRPTRGKGRGRDRRRHLRSAWDIAWAARQQSQLTRRAAAGTGGTT